jgi:hypothetical protein
VVLGSDEEVGNPGFVTGGGAPSRIQASSAAPLPPAKRAAVEPVPSSGPGVPLFGAYGARCVGKAAPAPSTGRAATVPGDVLVGPWRSVFRVVTSGAGDIEIGGGGKDALASPRGTSLKRPREWEARSMPVFAGAVRPHTTIPHPFGTRACSSVPSSGAAGGAAGAAGSGAGSGVGAKVGASAPCVVGQVLFDGGSRGNPGLGGFGCVILAADGTVVHKEGGFLGVCTNNEAGGAVCAMQAADCQPPPRRCRAVLFRAVLADPPLCRFHNHFTCATPEYEGCLRGLLAARRLSFTHVEVLGDSMLVLK